MRLLAWFAALALALALPASAAPKKKSPPPAAAAGAPGVLKAKLPAGAKLKLFAVSYASRKGTEGVLLLNGVNLTTFTADGGSGSTNLAARWLFPGTNTVEIVTTKLTVPKKDDFDDRPPITVSLHGLAEPGFPDEDNALWKIEVAGQPGLRKYTFDLPPDQAPASALPAKAAVLPAVTKDDEAALTALAQGYVDAIHKGDAGALRGIWAFRLADQARIDGQDPKELADQADKSVPMLAKLFAKAKLPPFLEFRLVAGGRVVQVAAKGGKPAIQAGTEEDDPSIDLYFAKIDGAWTLVR